MSTLEIQRQLVLSTAHLSQTARAWLNEGDWRRVDGSPNALRYFISHNILSIPYEYGWIVWVDGDADPDETPGEIMAALELAREHRCDWIKYDRDGPVEAELPEFEDGTDRLAGQAEVIDLEQR